MSLRRLSLLRFLLSRHLGPAAFFRALFRERLVAYNALDLAPLLPASARFVIDVGAHAGDFSAAVRWLLRPERLLLVEPQPALAESLRTRYAGDPAVTVVQACAGAEAASANFHLHAFTAASSLYDCRAGHLRRCGLAEDSSTITVPVRRLDQLLADLPPQPIDLLKLDCQGAELAALQGLGRFLPRVRHLICEVSFEPIYDRAPLFGEVHAFLLAHGFVLRSLHDLSGADGSVQWADAVYLNLRPFESPDLPAVAASP